MPVREQSAIFGLSAATLTRKAGARTRLRPEPSDRVFRVAATLALAQDVLEDRDRAVSWLREPNRELHGERPLDLLDTEVGAREVERVLMRLEHGIYS